MALGPLQIFRSKCQGVGYWTHFLLGAFVAIVKLSGYDACNCGAFSLSNVLAATLIMYQIFDYLYGEELMMSDEFALFRDLMEYVIGYVLVMVGSYMQKRKRSQSRATQVSSPGTSASLSTASATIIVFGSLTFELSRVTIQIILPIIFKHALGLTRDEKSTLFSLNFFGSFLGMFAAAPLTGLLGSQRLTSFSLFILGALVLLLSIEVVASSFASLQIAMFVMGLILSIVSVGLNTTVQIVSTGVNRSSANALYRASGLISIIVGPQITWLMEYKTAGTTSSNTIVSTAHTVLRILAAMEVVGAMTLLHFGKYSKAHEEYDKKVARKRNLSLRKVTNIFDTVYNYRPLLSFCVVLSCIASIEPVSKGYLPDFIGGTPSFQSSMHSLAATVSLLLVGTQFLKEKDCRSALFTFACLHSVGMMALFYFAHPVAKASAYMLVKVSTDLAKIPTGIWTTKCAEGYLRSRGGDAREGHLTVAVVVASGLAMQKLLGSLLKAFVSAAIGMIGEENIELDQVFGALMLGGLISTFFIGKLPDSHSDV
eukprot:g14095.t1